MTATLEETLTALDAELARLGAEAERIKASPGDLAKLGSELREIRAQEEVAEARRNATLDGLRQKEATALRGQLERYEERLLALAEELKKEAAMVMETLTGWWTQAACDRVRFPGARRNSTDTEANNPVRRTFREKSLLEEREQLQDAIGQANKRIRTLENADE